VPSAKTIKITASDGVQTTLRMWSPVGAWLLTEAKVSLIPGAAVDHQIFALPTIRRNAMEYFTGTGHEVFVITLWMGKAITAQRGYFTFDARLDIKAGLEEIRKLQGSDDKICLVAHSEGPMALLMALLNRIAGVRVSSVFTHPKRAKVNMLKASSLIPLPKLHTVLAGSWFSCTFSYHDTIVQQLINQALRFYVLGGVGEICNSVICHGSELVFGRYVLPFS